MNKTLGEALDYAEQLRRFVAGFEAPIQPFVVPSFTAVRDVKRVLAGTPIKVGAQNMHWAESGAWTGEVSPLQLHDCGVDLVELGHSERRQHFGETDDTVARKVAAAVRFGFTPLICVGETLADREAGRGDDVLAAQTSGALQLVEGAGRWAPILFAYEPVWAIGEHGSPASPEYADGRHALIKDVAGSVLSNRPPVLYGGSVDRHNAAEMIACPHVDGLFVGRAAWSVDGYIEILDRAASAIRLLRPIDTA